jgi:hypothetical protein
MRSGDNGVGRQRSQSQFIMETTAPEDPKSQEGTLESRPSAKRPREEDKKDQSGETKKDPTGSIISNGFLDFPLSSIHSHLVCSLCSGYFKDPYTVTECCHTFCKYVRNKMGFSANSTLSD